MSSSVFTQFLNSFGFKGTIIAEQPMVLLHVMINSFLRALETTIFLFAGFKLKAIQLRTTFLVFSQSYNIMTGCIATSLALVESFRFLLNNFWMLPSKMYGQGRFCTKSLFTFFSYTFIEDITFQADVFMFFKTSTVICQVITSLALFESLTFWGFVGVLFGCMAVRITLLPQKQLVLV